MSTRPHETPSSEYTPDVSPAVKALLLGNAQNLWEIIGNAAAVEDTTDSAIEEKIARFLEKIFQRVVDYGRDTATIKR